MTPEELYDLYPEVLQPGDLRDVPAGWLGILDQYFAVVAPIMAGTGYKVVSAREYHAGLDLTWTSRLGAMTTERHEVMDRQDTLLDLRSYHTCPVCGHPATDWKAEPGKYVVRCEEHGVGERVDVRAPFTRSTRDGFVRYDPVADDLIVVWHPAGDE